MMLARAAGDFYWTGRYFERAEHTARLLDYHLAHLVDTPADVLARGWQLLYAALAQPPPISPTETGDAEAFLVPDAFALAAHLIEDTENPDAIIQSWTKARDNAKQLRPWLPVRVWTCLNDGFLWLRDCDFTEYWAQGPNRLPAGVVDRLRHLSGVIEARMSRDNAWRFLELGRFVERLQLQTALLRAWSNPSNKNSQVWAGLLEVCAAYEAYCRTCSMVIQPRQALAFLIANPEVSRSLSFATRSVQILLSDIDPAGGRYPRRAPHRRALRLAGAIETNLHASAEIADTQDFLGDFAEECRTLHDLIIAEYIDYPLEQGLPS
ncbi:MAG: alpha-E domain-containing protein [Rhodothermaceae bacterium]|nr:alpha-E domain-containing protein [Rhodothermaceae bacterium]MYI18052.1 alpha-E domain-containing protein [Rhodothermaceae bacterium]